MALSDAKTEDKKTDETSMKFQRPHKILAVLLGTLVLVLVFALGVHAGRFAPGRAVMRLGGPGGFSTYGMDGHAMMRGGGFGGGYGASMMQEGNQISGVVTAVNGTNFTLAGHGSTSTIQTSGSTQYHGGDKVNLNDTVSVVGTNNNGTWTATQIVINP